MSRCRRQRAEASPEREEEPLGRAWPLCGSDLSQSSHALSPLPHHRDGGQGRGPGPCGNSCFCQREQPLLLGLKSRGKGFLPAPSPGSED